MDLVIWTKDEDTGDLVPYQYGDVEEVTVTVTQAVRMSAQKQTIHIKEQA